MAGIITALKTQSKNKKRVNVYLDGKFSFSLTKVLARELIVGQLYSDAQIAELKRQDDEEKTYQRALRLIGHRPRSEYELRNKFKNDQVLPEVQEAVIERLREMNLVDDFAFAKAWVENRSTFRPRSAFALRDELRRKGVPREAIESALIDFNDEEAAYLAARKAARRWKNSNQDKFQQRVGDYLVRRGFSYLTISTVVARVWRETMCVGDESEVSK